MKINKLITNKIIFPKKNNYAAIIGTSPSKSARSPKLWNKTYKKLKSKTKMLPLDVKKKELKKLMRILKKDKNYLGGSVTIPYKEEIIKHLDKIDTKAKLIGSVNTVVRKGKILIGHNTDYIGSLSTLKKININKRKKNILIIGCGGAGKAVILSVDNYFNQSNILIKNRNITKAKKFVKNFSSRRNKIKVLKDQSEIISNNLDLIINCSSLGFDEWIENKNKFINKIYLSPLSSNQKFYPTSHKNLNYFFEKNKKNYFNSLGETIYILSKNKNVKVFDIIFKPVETILLRTSKIMNLNFINGKYMNLIQAVAGFSIVNKYNKKKNIERCMSND